MLNKIAYKGHPGILINKIPVSGFAGLLFAVASLLICLSLPEVRAFLLIGLAGGIPFAALLSFWHNQTRW